MILHRNKETNTVQATLKGEQQPEIYDCSFSACQNPTCLCSTLELELRPLPSVFDGNTEPMRMVVDLKERKVGKSEIRSLTGEETILSNAFVDLLDDEDFSILIAEFKNFKNRISETSDLESLDIIFDFNDIEDKGAMIAYNDILPYGNSITIEIEDHQWVVLDQHCVKSGCNCSDVYLEFNRYTSSGDFDEVFFVLSLDYKKKTWAEFEQIMNCPWPIERIKKTLEEFYPDFYTLIAERHDKLKTLYMQSKKKYLHENPPTVTKKVGRNDLCPCGSGKKFKKCCM